MNPATRGSAACGQLTLNRRARRRQVTQRIRIVDLPQDVVGKPYSVDPPAAVQRRSGGRPQLRGMVEMFVVGLEEPPVRHPELLDAPAWIAIRSEQDAVLVLEKELANLTIFVGSGR